MQLIKIVALETLFLTCTLSFWNAWVQMKVASERECKQKDMDIQELRVCAH